MALSILSLCAAHLSPPNADHLFRYWLLSVKSEARHSAVHIIGPFVEGGSEWSYAFYTAAHPVRQGRAWGKPQLDHMAAQ